MGAVIERDEYVLAENAAQQPALVTSTASAQLGQDIASACTSFSCLFAGGYVPLDVSYLRISRLTAWLALSLSLSLLCYIFSLACTHRKANVNATDPSAPAVRAIDFTAANFENETAMINDARFVDGYPTQAAAAASRGSVEVILLAGGFNQDGR